MSFGGLTKAFRIRVAVLALALAGTVTAGVVVSFADRPARGAFLARRGQTLLLGGAPYRYLGQTVTGLIGCTSGRAVPSPAPSDSGPATATSVTAPSDADLDAFFGSLRPRTVVRTWAPAEAGAASVTRLVAAAKRNGQMLALVLGNGRDRCAEPDRSGTAERGHRDADWYRSGYETSLLPWIRELVPRLRDEAAVAMWEIADTPSTDVDQAVVRAFYDAAGAEIHRLDKHHLVAGGTAAPSGIGSGDWLLIQHSPQLDVATMYDYDMNAGPSARLADALAGAADVDKPLVITELGVFASRGGEPTSVFDPARPADTACVDWGRRAVKVQAKLDASFATRLAGVSVWRSGFPGDGEAVACSIAAGASGDDSLLTILHDYPVSAEPPSSPSPSPADASPSAGASASAEPSATPVSSPPPLPAIPTGLTGTPGDGQVTLCWNKAAGAAWYSVLYRDTVTRQEWQRMSYPVKETCWTGHLYINGHAYDFKIRGAGPNGESGDSNVITLTPMPPRPVAVTDLTGTPGNAKVTLCWAKAQHATGYNIYYRDVTAGQGWTRMPYPIKEPCWTGGSFLNDHTYELKVRGANGFTEGPDSNVVTVVPRV